MKLRLRVRPPCQDIRDLREMQAHDELVEQYWRMKVAKNPTEIARLEREQPVYATPELPNILRPHVE